MGLLGIFSRKPKEEQPKGQPTIELVECPHVILSPRWDSVADIGHEDRAVGYRCIGCNQQFTVEEAEKIREAAKKILEAEAAALEQIKKEV